MFIISTKFMKFSKAVADEDAVAETNVTLFARARNINFVEDTKFVSETKKKVSDFVQQTFSRLLAQENIMSNNMSRL